MANFKLLEVVLKQISTFFHLFLVQNYKYFYGNIEYLSEDFDKDWL